MRGWLSPRLRAWPPRHVVTEVAVVLGELVTNAFRHARPPFAVRISVLLTRCALRVEVQDGWVACASGWALGRGLLIVRDLCQDWGVEHRADGKVVWADVPIPPASGGRMCLPAGRAGLLRL